MGTDWTGRWETNYGLVELRQEGETVTGKYVLKQGRISGRRSEDKLAGVWSEAPSYAPPDDAGEFEIRMNPSGESFKGRWWKPGSAKEHEWHGQKIASAGYSPI